MPPPQTASQRPAPAPVPRDVPHTQRRHASLATQRSGTYTCSCRLLETTSLCESAPTARTPCPPGACRCLPMAACQSDGKLQPRVMPVVGCAPSFVLAYILSLSRCVCVLPAAKRRSSSGSATLPAPSARRRSPSAPCTPPAPTCAPGAATRSTRLAASASSKSCGIAAQLVCWLRCFFWLISARARSGRAVRGAHGGAARHGYARACLPLASAAPTATHMHACTRREIAAPIALLSKRRTAACSQSPARPRARHGEPPAPPIRLLTVSLLLPARPFVPHPAGSARRATLRPACCCSPRTPSASPPAPSTPRPFPRSARASASPTTSPRGPPPRARRPAASPRSSPSSPRTGRAAEGTARASARGRACATPSGRRWCTKAGFGCLTKATVNLRASVPRPWRRTGQTGACAPARLSPPAAAAA